MSFSTILCLFLYWGFGVALVPPHPDLLEDPSFAAERRDWHRRLHSDPQHYSENKLLHPDACQYVSPEECKQADDLMVQQADSVRKLTAHTGHLRSLVLLLRWAEHKERELPTREEINLLLNGEGTDPLLYPTGSVREYIKTTSYNKLDIQMEIPLDWTLTDNTMEHYAFNRSGITPLFTGSFNPILNALDAKVNWADYDQDGDGRIDSLIVIHSGYPGEKGARDNNCGVPGESRNRIWSHAIGWNRDEVWTSKNGAIKLGTYMTTSAFSEVCRPDIARIGTATHELFHTWGLPDLYDSNGWIGKGTGVFDIMGHPYGKDGKGLNPGFLSPWSSMQLGWVEPTLLQYNGNYNIEPIQTSGKVYRIDDGFPEGEYLLIENRQPYLWDSLLFDGGILIWHIDETAKRQRNRGYPGQEGWPGNGNHYRVALVQGDGQFDLEEGTNIGDERDFYVQGMDFRPGPGVAIATERSLYPNTDAYQGGNINVTGIRIFDFSPSQEVMSFEVAGLAPPLPTTPPPSASPTPPPSASPTPPPSASPTTRPATSNPTTSPTISVTPEPTVTLSTAIPTLTPTAIRTLTPSTAMPTLTPSTAMPTALATSSATSTSMPTFSPILTPMPTGTMQPSPDTIGVTGAQGDSAGSDGVNVGLAVGLALLFTVSAAIAGCWVWETYYKEPSDNSTHTENAAVVEDGFEGDIESGVEVTIGVECPQDIKSDCGSMSVVSNSSSLQAAPLARQGSVATTVSDTSANSIAFEGQTALGNVEEERSKSPIGALTLQRQSSTDSAVSDCSQRSNESSVMGIDNAISLLMSAMSGTCTSSSP